MFFEKSENHILDTFCLPFAPTWAIFGVILGSVWIILGHLGRLLEHLGATFWLSHVTWLKMPKVKVSKSVVFHWFLPSKSLPENSRHRTVVLCVASDAGQGSNRAHMYIKVTQHKRLDAKRPITDATWGTKGLHPDPQEVIFAEKTKENNVFWKV